MGGDIEVFFQGRVKFWEEKFRVQSPESRVQSPGSRVQGPVELLGYGMTVSGTVDISLIDCLISLGGVVNLNV